MQAYTVKEVSDRYSTNTHPGARCSRAFNVSGPAVKAAELAGDGVADEEDMLYDLICVRAAGENRRSFGTLER